jgi:hypothetical protein
MLIVTDGLPRGHGYLEVDHRNSPADLPAGVARYIEADTYTCSHCQRIVVMNPMRKRERYKCNGCSKHICDECAAKCAGGAPCKTFAQIIDQHLKEQRHGSL